MPVSSDTRFRIIVVMAFLAAAGLVMVGQLVRWQVFERQSLLDMAGRQPGQQQSETIPPQRGSIYDRNEILLATDAYSYSVSVSPDSVPYPKEMAEELAPLLGYDQSELETILTSEAQWYGFDGWVPLETGIKINEMGTEMGYQVLWANKKAVRVYPAGSLAAHLLGFVNINRTGFYGVEGYHEDRLRGEPGERLSEPDPSGHSIPIGSAEYRPARDGSDLYLTIDSSAQYIVEKELAQAIQQYEAEDGTVVVLDPKTGAIVAMASWPAYDPNDFKTTDPAMYQNPAVSSQYEPGSVFKVITIAAALDSGAIQPDSVFYDNGAIEVGGGVIYNWDRAPHGEVNVTQVLAKSLNVESAHIAVIMGWEQFYTYVRRFGFGKITDVDLAGESSGQVKTPEDADWYESELGTNSFGQGIAVTPLQMASAVGAIANDGLLMKPYVVQRIVSGEDDLWVDPIIERRAVAVETAWIMTEMMMAAVDQEITLAQVPGYKVAGKSGTAQIPVAGGYHPSETVASFAGYLPADDPAYVILVVINEPKVSPWGGVVAAPVFSRIAQQLVVLSDIPPDVRRHQLEVQQASQVQN